jgi:hypothetical protein
MLDNAPMSELVSFLDSRPTSAVDLREEIWASVFLMVS